MQASGSPDFTDSALAEIEVLKLAGRVPELESLRSRDNDLSIKGAGVLGFAGLLLAADMVLLTAPAGSYLETRSPWDAVAYGAVLVLVLGAFIAVLSVYRSGIRHAFDAIAILNNYTQYIAAKRRLVRTAQVLSVLGMALFLVAVMGTGAKKFWLVWQGS